MPSTPDASIRLPNLCQPASQAQRIQPNIDAKEVWKKERSSRVKRIQQHTVTVVGGSDLCRKALWQWVFTRIEPQRCRLKNDIGDQLGKIIDAEKLSGGPVKLVRSRVAAKAVKLLFKELVRELTQ
jgi:hypothetical protein